MGSRKKAGAKRIKRVKAKKDQLLQAPRTKAGKENSSNGTANQETNSATETEEKEITIQIRNCEWIRDRIQKNDPPIYTLDLETDPFARGNVPVPFVAGFYDGITFRSFWTDKNSTCLEKAKCFLEELEPGIVYMHNGGRFDFFYFLDWFEGKSTLISSRIVKTLMPLSGKDEYHEFRDSYAIMPFPLKAYKKEEIDINKLSRENREKNRAEIERYLTGDCVYLWELCMQFQSEFGNYLTIASAAFNQLSERHSFDTLPQSQDAEIRKRFYYGGRVQCFRKGVITQPLQIFDVNSMYPSVMMNFSHPISWISSVTNSINKDTYFLTVEGENNGAFCVRQKDGSISFEQPIGRFHTTIHEYRAALELGLFKTHRIIECFNFSNACKFNQFVDHFYHARKDAQARGDEMHKLFYKYILNSAYGKFALNPENYFNWQITRTAEPPKGISWELDSMVQGKFYVWKQPSQTKWNLKNIATAASITGAARSILLRAIAKSKNVIYCDTDSIICEEFAGGVIDSKTLGAWKAEGVGTHAAIAGKKMYAIFNGEECIKHANKGVNLSPAEIVKVCNGEDVISFRDAPTFQRTGEAKFIERKVRMT